MAASREEIVDYIRQAAQARGIDPDVAVAVARSEGLNANPEEGWQSNVVKDGVREPSFGPFQLYMGGGLGNKFQAKTGLDPRDPSTVFKQIDFALDEAKRGGWGPWYGAKAIGLSEREGLDVAPASQATPEARLRQYGLGDADPGTTGQVLDAVRRGDMTKSEAGKYVSEELLEGVKGGSAYDILKGDKEEASFLDRLGKAAAYMDFAGIGQAPEQPDFPSMSMRINEGRPNTGSRALKRMGIASLA